MSQDTGFLNYFCIFCKATFTDLQGCHEHYIDHLSKTTSFCQVCDCQPFGVKCTAQHDNHFRSAEEEDSVKSWLGRFMTYQSKLVAKSREELLSKGWFSLGCPICDTLAGKCSVDVPNEVKKYRRSLPVDGTLIPGSLSIGHTGEEEKALRCTDPIKLATVRHVFRHLQYLPFECRLCKDVGGHKAYTTKEEALKHAEAAHGHLFPSLSSLPSELIIKTVAVTKIETFLEHYLNSKPIVRYKPIPRKAITHTMSGSDSDASGSKQSHAIESDASSSRSENNHNQQDSKTSASDSETDSQPTIPKFTVIKSKKSRSNSSSIGDDKKSMQQQFGNIFDDDESMANMSGDQEENPDFEYFCLFCDEKFKSGKEDAKRHYQEHIGYFPLVCSLCGTGVTDLPEFLKHHTEVHPEAEKGRFKRREQPHIDKWISTFLYSQSTIIKALPPREQCPVCEKVFSSGQIKLAKPRRCTVNRKIDHIHRHLSYLPYECTRCKEEGKEFTVAYFESKAHSHIKLKHSEIDYTESRWNVFQKNRGVPHLDNWLREYLAKFGISADVERRPVKKHMSENGSVSGEFLSNHHIPSDISVTSLDTSETDMTTQTQPLDFSIKSTSNYASNNRLRNVLTESGASSMIISISPYTTEAYLTLQNSVPAFKSYFCVFCPQKFQSKVDAFFHYSVHLEYKPVACLLCDKSFHNVSLFSTHQMYKHPEVTELKYDVREDQDIEKWVESQVESQRTLTPRRMILKCSCSNFCQVCDNLSRKATLSATPCSAHNDIVFSDHLHQHLTYNAYECMICKKVGKQYRVPNLDLMAVNHLKTDHGMQNATMYQICRSFPKKISIPLLEKHISDCLSKKRLFDKKINKVDPILNQLLSRQQNGPKIGKMVVRQLGRKMIVTNHARYELLMKNNQPFQTMKEIQAAMSSTQQHVRVVGDRVINLPGTI